MSGLPTIVPRLVVATEDVQDLLSQLAEEHMSLQAELHRLTLELEALSAGSPEWAALEDAVTRAAAEEVRRRCVERHDAAFAEIDALVEGGEAAAAVRVEAAEAEASAHLAAVRTEIGDRLVADLYDAEPDPDQNQPGPNAEVPAGLTEPAADGVIEADSGAPDAATWDDAGPDGESFRSFWSEHDEGASVREAIAAPLVAIAPMLLALLVIVFVLLLFV